MPLPGLQFYTYQLCQTDQETHPSPKTDNIQEGLSPIPFGEENTVKSSFLSSTPPSLHPNFCADPALRLSPKVSFTSADSV